MREALAQVREVYGTDAAILHAREVDPGLLTRLLRGKWIEVVARPIELNEPEQEAAPQQEQEPPVDDSGDYSNRVATRLGKLQSTIDNLQQNRPMEEEQSPEQALKIAYKNLLQADVAPAAARKLIEKARIELPREALTEPTLIREFLAAALNERLHGVFTGAAA